MKQLFTLLTIILFSVSCDTGTKLISGYDGFYCKTMSSKAERYNDQSKFYDLQKNETVVSIGADACTNEAVYGLEADSVHFILENITSKSLNQKQLDFSKQYYEKLYGKKSTSTYSIQIGNETSTLIEPATADKVLIENSFHEFSEPQKMIQEVSRILKPGGNLYLFEILSSPKKTIHKGCHRKLYSKDELIQAMEKENFHFVSSGESKGLALLKFSKG